MNKLIAWIEKGKPFFEKISRNIYLRAIRDGFIAAIPIILFSSIFILILYALDLLSRAIVHTNVANAVLKVFEPLFTAADG